MTNLNTNLPDWIEDEIVQSAGIERLKKDEKESARKLGRRQARFLVDLFYQTQRSRIRAGQQAKAAADGEGREFLDWMHRHWKGFERNISGGLLEFAKQHTPGLWMLSLFGVGPVLAGGFLAHLDATDRPTAGSFWRFAGLDSTLDWTSAKKAEALIAEMFPDIAGTTSPITIDHANQVALRLNRRGETLFQMASMTPNGGSRKPTAKTLASAIAMRPWNAKLKTLVWKFATTQFRFHKDERCVYGQVIADRRALEWARNLTGAYADTALQKIEDEAYGPSTDAYKWCVGRVTVEEARAVYSGAKLQPNYVAAGEGQPMLSPGYIHNRALRYGGKLFLSHLHHVMWEDLTGEKPPKPYVIEHMGHAHYKAPPNWPMA